MIVTQVKARFDPVTNCLVIAQDYRADVQFSKNNPDDANAIPEFMHEQMLKTAEELEKLDSLLRSEAAMKYIEDWNEKFGD